jgi:7,8-dihydropterin-6-yl-methyl-4-(beta-D-ribofuranosyl)aminobenzene 5'-phosphate synthase
MAHRRITVLVDNTAGGRGLPAEHGLSFWIELGSRHVLFDTGQGNVLSGNARKLGVRLELTDAIVLSHGHYDHTGGLDKVLRSARRTPVYAHVDAFVPKYARGPDGTVREIGIPPLAEQAVRQKAELIWTEGPMDVLEGLRVTGPVPRVTDFEGTGGPFFADKACTQPDLLVDDQAAFIETSAGTIVILGCAHAGIVNTLRYIQNLTAGRAIHTVIGGTHLHSVSPERMDKTVDELRQLDVQRLLPCHCTGATAVARLWSEFPGRCIACSVGTAVDFKE